MAIAMIRWTLSPLSFADACEIRLVCFYLLSFYNPKNLHALSHLHGVVMGADPDRWMDGGGEVGPKKHGRNARLNSSVFMLLSARHPVLACFFYRRQ